VCVCVFEMFVGADPPAMAAYSGVAGGHSGGLAALVADAERQPAAASPIPDSTGAAANGVANLNSRILRVEVNGLLHDWFDVEEMGDFVKSTAFASTLRENVARYFGVQVASQAIYDEDGLLTTNADFSRALQRVTPMLYIYDVDEMGAELVERTCEELEMIDQEVRQWNHLRTRTGKAKMLETEKWRRSEGAPELRTSTEGSYAEGGSGGTPTPATVAVEAQGAPYKTSGSVVTLGGCSMTAAETAPQPMAGSQWAAQEAAQSSSTQPLMFTPYLGSSERLQRAAVAVGSPRQSPTAHTGASGAPPLRIASAGYEADLAELKRGGLWYSLDDVAPKTQLAAAPGAVAAAARLAAFAPDVTSQAAMRQPSPQHVQASPVERIARCFGDQELTPRAAVSPGPVGGGSAAPNVVRVMPGTGAAMRSSSSPALRPEVVRYTVGNSSGSGAAASGAATPAAANTGRSSGAGGYGTPVAPAPPRFGAQVAAHSSASFNAHSYGGGSLQQAASTPQLVQRAGTMQQRAHDRSYSPCRAVLTPRASTPGPATTARAATPVPVAVENMGFLQATPTTALAMQCNSRAATPRRGNATPVKPLAAPAAWTALPTQMLPGTAAPRTAGAFAFTAMQPQMPQGMKPLFSSSSIDAGALNMSAFGGLYGSHQRSVSPGPAFRPGGLMQFT